MFDIKEQLKKLPDEPGVYLMKDVNNQVIYVGKAISLKNRVRQYFQSSKNHSSKVIAMVKNIHRFEYIMTDSELEALILECNLIKQYKPKYNVLLRDDKTYPYIKVTTNEDFPRILKVRKLNKDKAKYFGPYTNISAVNDTLEIINQMYPIRSCNIDIDKAIKNKVRPCLNYHIKKCIGPCTASVSKEQYKLHIEEILLFLSGKEEKLIENLKEKMNECAMDFKFEDAAIYRDKIKNLEEIIEKQKIDATSIDLNQDVIAMAKADDEACVQVFFVRNGKIVGREHYILQRVEDSSRENILSSFVKQFYLSQEYIPSELLIEYEIEDNEIIEQWLSEKKNQKVNIKVPQKGDKKSLINMVSKNAMEYLLKFTDLNKMKYQKTISAIEELKELLRLECVPRKIESFDISNIQGVDSIGSMVVFTDGKKDKKEYRRYKIKTVEGPNDYASMAEIVERRLKYGNLPNLMLLDGGKGQISAVQKILDLYEVDIPLWGMIKDDKHKTKGVISREKEIILDRTSNIYRFIASIQEEVHNYAITYHRSLRNKSLTKSILDDIPNIGDKRKKSLLNYFGNIDNIKIATLDELEKADGMNKNSSKSVYDFFRKDR